MQSDNIRRLVYASQALGDDIRNDLLKILASSRRNNGLDGVTGILWLDGSRYLQLLEGPAESVGAAFDRISRDPRHHEIMILDDVEASDRAFGDWAMAAMPSDTPDDAAKRLARLLRNSPHEVTRYFPAMSAAA